MKKAMQRQACTRSKGSRGRKDRDSFLSLLCLVCFLCFAPSGRSQTVPVLDTLYNADGTTASGRIVISWSPFTAPDGTTVDGGTLTYTIPATGGSAGVVSLSLYPNAGASPAGTSYAARYFLANGAQYAETWVVPASGPATIADVRVLNAPVPGSAIPISTLTGGPLGVTLGGTGLDAIGGANLCLKVNSAGTALEYGSCATGGTGITSLNGQMGPTQTFATGTTGSDFGISSAADTHTFHLPSASGASRGALTSADWTAFDNSVDSVSGTANEISSSGGQTPAIGLATQLNLSAKELLGGASPLRFEGATDDNVYTTLSVTNPTAPRTFTLPNADSVAVQPDAGAANNFLTAISAAGVISKTQPSFADLSGAAAAGQVPNLESLNGTLDVSSGGTGGAPGAGDQALISDSTSAATWRAIPNCNTENMLTYSTATNTFGCESDDGGGGGGDNISVNGTAASDADFDNATPAAPANSFNVRWQKDASAPNNISAHLLTTDIGSATFGSGSGFTWTFDAGATDPAIAFASGDLKFNTPTLTLEGGATDPVLTPGDGVLNLSTGTLQQGGTAVVLQTRTISTSGAALTGGGDLSANRTITLSASPDSASVVGTGRTLTGGAGIAALGNLSADRTIQTASGETDFLASGALACGAGTRGRTQVHTTPLQYCDNAATPALQYAAYGASDGDALAGDSATAFFDTGTVEAARLPNLSGLNGQISDTQIAAGAVDGGSGGEIADGTVDSNDLATPNKTIAKSITILNPTTSETNQAQFYWPAAVTLQRIACSTDVATSTVSINFDERVETTPNTAGTNTLAASLVCDTNSEITTTFSDSVIAADVPYNLQITATANSPTVVRIHVKAQIN